ncbi:MAG: hypothetical protein ABIF12_02095 [bacterium]
MNNKKILFIFIPILFISCFLKPKKVEILREDLLAKYFYFKTWEIEDTFFKQENLNTIKFKEYIKNKYKTDCFTILGIVYDNWISEDIDLDESKWESVEVQNINSLVIDI